jgi:hypothetical protein
MCDLYLQRSIMYFVRFYFDMNYIRKSFLNDNNARDPNLFSMQYWKDKINLNENWGNVHHHFHIGTIKFYYNRERESKDNVREWEVGVVGGIEKNIDIKNVA